MKSILTKIFGNNIAEIITTYLWKERFNSVIDEIELLRHDFNQEFLYNKMNRHIIWLNKGSLIYNNRSYFPYCVSERNMWLERKVYNAYIWLK